MKALAVIAVLAGVVLIIVLLVRLLVSSFRQIHASSDRQAAVQDLMNVRFYGALVFSPLLLFGAIDTGWARSLFLAYLVGALVVSSVVLVRQKLDRS